MTAGIGITNPAGLRLLRLLRDCACVYGPEWEKEGGRGMIDTSIIPLKLLASQGVLASKNIFLKKPSSLAGCGFRAVGG
jgi:hypothetical protein